MKNNIINLVKSFMEELQADTYKKGKDWNGYTVYEPVYNKPVCIGFPLIVLVKDGEVRLSTDEESIRYLNFTYPDDEDEE